MHDETTSPNSDASFDSSLDDQLDALVSEYADAKAAGRHPRVDAFLGRVPQKARPGLERALKMIDAGTAQAPSLAMPLSPGTMLGTFRLESELGRGGMAIVWLARDTELDRPVALKILRPGLALEERHVDRFRREAMAVASLTDPHIVQIHGVGHDRGYHWLAMEFVEGPSLATVLEALPTDRPRTAEDLARATGIVGLGEPGHTFERAMVTLLAPVAGALVTAHARGLVHRDVKPSNILIHRDGRAVIADFGLAKGDDDPALSLTGEGLGTPYYMSPEQAWVTGKTVDHRSDVYSFGVTLYEALSGHRPFQGESFLEVIDAIRRTHPPSLRQVAPGSSHDAAAVVRRAMARDPEDRYSSAAGLHGDLVALARGHLTSARQEEGGLLRRAWAQFKMARSGAPYEYRSATTFLGLPLVHIVAGTRQPGSPARVAKGWYASGDIAYGALAFGPRAVGGFACGGLTAGLVSFGGLGVGLFTWAGIGVGLISFAGIALGRLAMGGIAWGHIALGGLVRGEYAAGGMAFGTHTISGERTDPVAEQYFEQLFESVWSFLSGVF